jgi:hypothetical protein
MEKLLPKIDPLPGSLHLERKRCGRANCRCLAGRLHGPYVIRHWREGGRQRKAYVPAAKVAATLLAIEARRASFPSVHSMLTTIKSPGCLEPQTEAEVAHAT